MPRHEVHHRLRGTVEDHASNLVYLLTASVIWHTHTTGGILGQEKVDVPAPRQPVGSAGFRLACLRPTMLITHITFWLPSTAAGGAPEKRRARAKRRGERCPVASCTRRTAFRTVGVSRPHTVHPGQPQRGLPPRQGRYLDWLYCAQLTMWLTRTGPSRSVPHSNRRLVNTLETTSAGVRANTRTEGMPSVTGYPEQRLCSAVARFATVERPVCQTAAEQLASPFLELQRATKLARSRARALADSFRTRLPNSSGARLGTASEPDFRTASEPDSRRAPQQLSSPTARFRTAHKPSARSHTIPEQLTSLPHALKLLPNSSQPAVGSSGCLSTAALKQVWQATANVLLHPKTKILSALARAFAKNGYGMKYLLARACVMEAQYFLSHFMNSAKTQGTSQSSEGPSQSSGHFHKRTVHTFEDYFVRLCKVTLVFVVALLAPAVPEIHVPSCPAWPEGLSKPWGAIFASVTIGCHRLSG